MRDYTKIEAWKLADDLTAAVYERTRSFPREEIYGLTSQRRRAAYSVPANIVEGSHGLIKAVEKEAGKLGKLVASITGLLVLALWSRSL